MLGNRFVWGLCVLSTAACLSDDDDDTNVVTDDASIADTADASTRADAGLVDDTVFYFFGQDDNGFEPWITDGTIAGTRMVADINTSGDGLRFGTPFFTNGDLTYFEGTDGTTDFELWVTDGTEQGTHLVEDINPAGAAELGNEFFVFDGEVIFMANNGTDGWEPYATDGTSARMLADINDVVGAGNSSFPAQFVEYKGNLLFTAGTAATGTELFEWDGTNATLVEDIIPGSNAGFPLSPIVLGDNLLFSANTSTMGTGRELWRYDGTDVVQLEDLETGPTSSDPENFTVFGSTLVFTATVGDDEELYVTDGTVGGASIAADINPGGTGRPFRLVTINGILMFIADDGTGHEWHTWDGTSATKLIDINPSGASFPVIIGAFNGLLYFSADNGTDREMWLTDGTAAGTRLLSEVIGIALEGFCNTIVGTAGGKLIIAQDSNMDGIGELWIAGDTPASLQEVPGVRVSNSKCF